MAKISILAGTTSKLLRIFVQNSSVTTGAGLTGLAFGTAGLTGYYIREGANATTQITLATQTLGTWATGGFIVVDGTNMPGCYEISIPNAAIASGAKSVLIYYQGAANMAPVVLEVELTAVDNQSTGFGLVNASANAVQFAGQTITAAAGVTIPSSIASPTNITSGTITTVTTVTNQLTAAAIATGVWQDATAGDFTTASSIGKSLYTTGATPGATGGLFIAGTNAATTITTGLTTTFTGNLTGSVASVTGAVGSVTGAVGSVTGAVGSVTGAVGSVTAAVTVSGTSALTESYAAQGAALTLAQALYGINQFLGQHSTSGTVWTVKKRDGSTTAKTYNLDSATTPTSLSEAT
jgi:hypothetical protein